MNNDLHVINIFSYKFSGIGGYCDGGVVVVLLIVLVVVAVLLQVLVYSTAISGGSRSCSGS